MPLVSIYDRNAWFGCDSLKGKELEKPCFSFRTCEAHPGRSSTLLVSAVQLRAVQAAPHPEFSLLVLTESIFTSWLFFSRWFIYVNCIIWPFSPLNFLNLCFLQISLAFWVWLLSLGVVHVRFIHALVCIDQYQSLLSSIVWYVSLHSPVEGHLVAASLGGSKTTINIHMQVFMHA